MANKLDHPVRPGGLGEDDHERIYDLSTRRGWKPGRIAREIEKHPATVQWFMYREGLIAPTGRQFTPYLRNGKLVAPFTREEDAFIQALRVQDYGTTKIAELTSKRFGHTRGVHSVHVRLTMLAAREGA